MNMQSILPGTPDLTCMVLVVFNIPAILVPQSTSVSSLVIQPSEILAYCLISLNVSCNVAHQVLFDYKMLLENVPSLLQLVRKQPPNRESHGCI